MQVLRRDALDEFGEGSRRRFACEFDVIAILHHLRRALRNAACSYDVYSLLCGVFHSALENEPSPPDARIRHAVVDVEGLLADVGTRINGGRKNDVVDDAVHFFGKFRREERLAAR